MATCPPIAHCTTMVSIDILAENWPCLFFQFWVGHLHSTPMPPLFSFALKDEDAADADVLCRLASVWGSNPEDVAGHAFGCHLDAMQGFATLRQHKVFPGRCSQTPLVPHGSDASNPVFSEHSSDWCKLLQKEWYSSDITSYFVGDGMEFYDLESDEQKTRYHGTTLKAALSMLSTGGFIPGPNGHGRKGKYLQGLFCASSVGEAVWRVDPWREARGTKRDPLLDLLGCPVVVELKVASFKLRRYHRHRRDLGVVPGKPGVLMTGVKLEKVHVNRRYFWNFCQSRYRNVSRAEACGHGKCNCGCWISVEEQDKLCKKWEDLSIGYKSAAGIVYSPHCSGMWCKHSYIMGMAP